MIITESKTKKMSINQLIDKILEIPQDNMNEKLANTLLQLKEYKRKCNGYAHIVVVDDTAKILTEIKKALNN